MNHFLTKRERYTNRIALHSHSNCIDATIDFYVNFLDFELTRDTALVNGERWAVLVRSTNAGIQLHLHSPRPDLVPQKLQFEIDADDPLLIACQLQAAGYSPKTWEWPYAWGFEIDDPTGNRLTVSWWGDEKDDVANGHQSAGKP
ncbi:hypothetical protein LBMAG46_26140 [Planctomycetia bacterium]|nr:hypothetical protein LBMAG46_26140 [Planctomycetia bacterium]